MQTRSRSSSKDKPRSRATSSSSSGTRRPRSDSELLRDEPRSEDGSESEAEKDEHGNLRDFVVPDDLIEDASDDEGFGLSDRLLEEAWKAWKPLTKAEERFKDVIDKHSKPKASTSKKIHQS